MLKKTLQFVVTYHTTAEAMATERVCRAKSIPGRLIPAPRNVTADCGIAWCSPPGQKTALLQALQEAAVETAGCFELEL